MPGDGARYYGTGEQEADDEEEATNDGRDDERDDDQDANNPGHNIQARLRRSPNVIVANTWANRPQRTRAAIDKYQAGTRTATKKPGMGARAMKRGPGRFIDVNITASTVDVCT